MRSRPGFRCRRNRFRSKQVFRPRRHGGFPIGPEASITTIILPRALKIARLELGNGDVSIEGMRGDVRADVVNGVLAARNCFGNVQLSVAQGGLDLFYERWEKRFTADAKIISGHARAFLPRTASFHLLAETPNGNVSNRFRELKERKSERATRVNMSIGSEPHPEISLRATNGDIEIAAAQA